ncbi:hypothetical protein R0H17_25145 [Phytobacter diazotrophicus]|uniref:hypothetical protein n=1 Tax=Phytobacter diazotrophicus TaxID=395631 RepID=UPI00206576C8|nr:hypothetical protein [Phytobacter diazotrophicus]MDV2904911.1 hypothetical protein [Phytobacter diazotrophicus]DAO81319.1 MAG TPA: tail assembly chaperone protein [Caudoviricetes sp.]
MNLDSLKKKLQPKRHEYKIDDETVIFIHRPTAMDMDKCKTLADTIIHCVKDENGDPIFANEDIDGRINVNSIDILLGQQIYGAILELFQIENPADEIEKK